MKHAWVQYEAYMYKRNQVQALIAVVPSPLELWAEE
jgi:hypothetical protein